VPDNIGEAYVSQHVAILRLGKEYIPEFISFYFSMADLGQRQIQKCQYGQTKPGLNLEQIKSFNIPDISIHNQKKFVDFMNKQKNSIRHSNEHNISADMLFNSLLQRAFRGQLNIQAVA
jgi:type I restriction enzyme S subunit